MAPDLTFAFVGGPWCPTLDFVIAFWITIYVSHIVNFAIVYLTYVRESLCRLSINWPDTSRLTYTYQSEPLYKLTINWPITYPGDSLYKLTINWPSTYLREPLYKLAIKRPGTPG
jgi:hypothetical protein